MKTVISLMLLLAFIVNIQGASSSGVILARKLKQDPVRTSDNARVDPSKNLDGSTGRYKKKHKTVNGKKFGKSRHRMKTVKPSHDNGKEKQRSRAKGSEVAG